MKACHKSDTEKMVMDGLGMCKGQSVEKSKFLGNSRLF